MFDLLTENFMQHVTLIKVVLFENTKLDAQKTGELKKEIKSILKIYFLYLNANQTMNKESSFNSFS
ncbi:CLUMA_CG016921, isoform A [Clunio marinus]|uniref:CLUMA_CG016921, isoform A n=1 Tax=Clunio marinus TaxID=568069 RepID=A0A1J1ITR4_9DIPT|nr:CLUMA_CG016921, isoform A [Clunio marinus]